MPKGSKAIVLTGVVIVLLLLILFADFCSLKKVNQSSSEPSSIDNYIPPFEPKPIEVDAVATWGDLSSLSLELDSSNISRSF
jgi:hypothetical protein